MENSFQNKRPKMYASDSQQSIDTGSLSMFMNNNYNDKSGSINGVSSIEGTPEIESILNAHEPNVVDDNAGKEEESYTDVHRKNRVKWDKNDTRQPINEDGKPLDIVEAEKYLMEKYETLYDVNLSKRLLQKKMEEDEGIKYDYPVKYKARAKNAQEEDEDDEDEEEEEDDEDEEEEEEEEEEEFEDLLEIFDIDPEEVSLDLTLNQKRKLLIDSMDENQLKRYEFFRRTNLNIGGIKKLINSITNVSIPNSNNDFAKIVGGIGKMFVGEVVEMAKQVQREENEFKVNEQIRYKIELKKYEEEPQRYEYKKPMLPSFYEQLQQQETGQRRRMDYHNISYSSFRVLVPCSPASNQLSPDHIREAVRRLNRNCAAANKFQRAVHGHSANGRIF